MRHALWACAVVATLQSALANCPDGWRQHGDRCYLFLENNIRATWRSARETCASYHSDLPSIRSIHDTVWLRDQMLRSNLTSFWTGLHVRNNENTWSDRSTFKLSYVGRHSSSDECGQIDTRGLSLHACQHERGVVCYKQAQPRDEDCAKGWELSNGRCYMFNTAQNLKLSWPDAKAYCDAMGSKLLIIDSKQVQDFINTKLMSIHETGAPILWLGLSDKNPERKLKWVNGKDVQGSFENWNKDQPIQIDGKNNYGQIFTGNPKGYWSLSITQLQQQAFACILPQGKVPIRPTAPPDIYECPKDTKRYLFHCYKFVHQTENWSQARYKCQQDQALDGGDLTTIRDEQESDFLAAEVKEHSWIGLHRVGGVFIWLDDAKSPLTYTNWNPGEPNNAEGVENCAEIVRETGKWNDHQCTEKRAYICKSMARVKNPGPTTPAPTRPWSPRCGINWEADKTSDFCYMFRQEFLGWAEARQSCQNVGGDLASITSLHEQRYLAGRINQMAGIKMWIGLNDKDTKFKWKWSDNSAAPFFNWGPGEPNNFGGAQDCGAVQLSDGIWDDDRCDVPYGYICKKIATDAASTTILPPTVTAGPGNVMGCNNGFSLWRGRCYRVVKAPEATISAGRSQCARWGGTLVSIRYEAEQGYVHTKVADVFKGDTEQSRGVFIGLTSLRVANQYEWQDLSPVTYTRWAQSEPNSDQENCVMMYIQRDGDWNDFWCDGRDKQFIGGFVCSSEPVEQSPTPSAGPSGCPPGYNFVHENKCYAFVNDKTTWQDAKGRCEAQGGVLTDINDRYEQALLVSNLATKPSDKYWIGLTNKDDPSGTYKWTTGRAVKYTNWDDKHTGNERDSCVTTTSGRFSGIWSDNQCTDVNNYICERTRDGYTTTMEPTTLPPKPCPQDWQEHNGYCYRGYQQTDKSQKLTFNEARDYCLAMGAQLASIHNEAENNFVKGLFYNYQDPNSWIGLRWSDGSSKWLDKTAFDYSRWENGQPKRDSPGVDDCVEFDQRYAQWRYTNCGVSKHWHCKIQKGKDLLLPSPAPTGDTSPSCGNDKDWRHFKNFCYYVSKTSDGENQKNWFDARKYCMNLGGDLASIHGLDENQFIASWVSKTDHSSLWMGLNELDERGKYKWSDKSASDYFMWAPGEPNDHHYGQLCVNFYSFSGKWNDDNCADGMGFICKKVNGTYIPNTDKPTLPVPGYCPNGWADADNKCFGVYPEVVDNFDIAVNKCRSMGQNYDIASITNQLESTVMTALMNDQPGGVYHGLTKRVQNRWQWIDNSPTTFTNWGPNEPNGGYNDKCVEVWKTPIGTWNDIPCDTKRGYVCETFKDASNIIQTTPPWPTAPQCPFGYYPFSKNCFKLYNDAKKWEDASAQCRSDQGELVSVHGGGENAFVALHTVDPNSPLWMGLNDKQQTGKYSWTDGWPVDYTNWGTNEPSKKPDEGCVSMDTDGRWNDTKCDFVFPYLCRIAKEPKPTTPKPTPPSPCGNDWYPYGGFCYYFSNDQKDFPNAQFDCTQRGSQIVSIHSQAENDFIYNKYIEKIGVVYPYEFYTGLTKNGLNKGFYWVDKTPVDYTNWAPGEPNDSVGNENCVEFYTNGGLARQWNDGYCNNNKRFVCKKRPNTWNTSPATTIPPPFSTVTTTYGPPVWTTSPGQGPASTTIGAPPPPPQRPGKGLTTGAKVGIAFGVIGALVIIAIIVGIVFKQRMRATPTQRLREAVSFQPPTYTEDGVDNPSLNDGKLQFGNSGMAYDA